MIRNSMRRIAVLLAVSDVGATLAALAAAYFLRFRAEIVPVTKGIPDPASYYRLFPLMAVLWPIVYYFYGLYQVRRNRSRVEEGLSVFVATGLATLLLAGLATFYRGFSYSRLVLLFFFALDVLFVFAGRTAIRRYLEEAWRHGVGVRHVLVVGRRPARPGASSTSSSSTRRRGCARSGFVDDDPGKRDATHRGLPVLGTTADVASDRRRARRRHGLPRSAARRAPHDARRPAGGRPDGRRRPRRAGPAPVHHLPRRRRGPRRPARRPPDAGAADGLDEPRQAHASTSRSRRPRSSRSPRSTRRSRWRSGSPTARPVLYRQRRMGLDGRPFDILKFRSMVVGAEEESGPTWASAEDPRRTRLGSFLRRWSLDELPQLVNVLRGEMSLVGPRPERPEFVREFKEKFPQYMLRHRVRAGITGWAQVHGWRGNTSLSKRIEYDLYYIENWSLALDIKILWMTLRHGLRHRNAY